MKIVNVIGGIGNQMFQYAFAYMLSIKHPDEDVYIDTSLFNGYRLHNGFELERLFGLKLPKAKWYQIARVNWYIPFYQLSRAVRKIFPSRKTLYRNIMNLTYDKAALTQTGNLYYDGYWQTAKYYEGHRQEILNLFRFSPLVDDKNKHYASLLDEQDSVAIHVRRGDYLKSAFFRGICEIDYYTKAITLAKERLTDPVFFIFSNDMAWCKANLLDVIGANEVFFVDNNKGEQSYRDMQLMSMARCMIIANSSFSWWAAYLNEREDSIVIAPSRWANLDRGDDIYMDEWVRL